MQKYRTLCLPLLVLAACAPAQDFDVQVRGRTVTTEFYYGHSGRIRADAVASWQIDSLDSVRLHEANAALLQKAASVSLPDTSEATSAPEALTISVSGQQTTFRASGVAPPDDQEDGRLSGWAKTGAAVAILLVAPELTVAGGIALDAIGMVNPLQDLVEWGTQDAERRAREARYDYRAACVTVGRDGRIMPMTYAGGFDFVRQTLMMPEAPDTVQAYLAGSVLSQFTGTLKLNLDPYEDFATGMFVSSAAEIAARNEAAREMARRGGGAGRGSGPSFGSSLSITGSQVSLGTSVLGNMDLSLRPTLPSVPSVQVQPNVMPVAQLAPVSAAVPPSVMPAVRAIEAIEAAGVANVEVRRTGQDVVTFIPQSSPSATSSSSSTYRESNLNLPKSISLTGDFGGFSFGW